MRICFSLTVMMAGVCAIYGQQISGKYHFQMLQISAGQQRSVSEPSNFTGTAVFGPDGRFTFDQRSVADNLTASGSGIYMASIGGQVVLTNPADPATTITARLGSDADLLLGAVTETSGLLSVFLAIKAPLAPVSPSVFSGTYRAAVLELLPGATAVAKARSLTFQSAGATLLLQPDGTGTLATPEAGTYEIIVSGDGGLIFGVPPAASNRGLLFAGRSATGQPAGLYWMTEFAVERDSVSVAIGSIRPDTNERARLSQRLNTFEGAKDFRGVNRMQMNADGSGILESSAVALSGAGTLIGVTSTPTANAIFLAVAAPAITGTGVFVNPHGVTDAASNTPGNPVSPSSIVSMYGSGLASRAVAAEGTSLPLSLADVAVEINGMRAPLYFVSPSQINLHVPIEIAGSEAKLIVTNAGVRSPSVAVPLALTSPAIFSTDLSGAGLGIITHADFSLVTAASPATAGEIVVIWATGLGSASPGLELRVGGAKADVLFAGQHPLWPGLYQINVRLPAVLVPGSAVPVSLVTREGFSDTVEVAIR